MKIIFPKKILIGFLLTLTACTGSGGFRGGDIDDAALADAMASGLNTVNQAMQLTDAGLAPAPGLAGERNRKTFSLIPSAFAALGDGGCSASDPNLTTTLSCDEFAHEASLLKDFGKGCEVEDGVTVTGKKWIAWDHTGPDACQIQNANRLNFWNAVIGTPPDAATRLASTDPDHPTNPLSPIVRVFDGGDLVKVIGYHSTIFSAYRDNKGGQQVEGDLTVPIPISRIRYRSDGTTKVYDHGISTPQAIHFLLENPSGMAPIQTIQSGELAVSQNLARFKVTGSFRDVKYDYNQCECFPVAGSLGIDVTDKESGQNIGSGTIAFNYGETGSCGSQSVNYQGRSISMTSLER